MNFTQAMPLLQYEEASLEVRQVRSDKGMAGINYVTIAASDIIII